MSPIKAILTDIEGTTSSIAFVKDVLFPYAAAALPAYVRAHAAETAVADILDEVATLSDCRREDMAALIAALQRWIAEDRKATPLKSLQGMLWRAGYEKGTYRAHIYPDAAEQLERWHRQGLSLFVYSSGSVDAQKLFFRYSEAGDLSQLFSGFFDTTVGGKRESSSYAKIAAAIGVPAEQILFLSDVVEELDAAVAAGLPTVWLQRPADCPAPQSSESHTVAFDFNAIDPASFGRK